MWQKVIFLLIAVNLAACASTSTTKHAGPSVNVQVGSNQADTQKTRMEAAKRYYLTLDMKKMVDGILRAGVARLPEDKRDEVFALAKAHLDTDELATIAIAAMVKNFSTNELDAMANFYGTPEGKSTAKYPAYIAEVMPAMFAEIQREIGDMQIEMQNSRDTRKTGT